MTTIADLPYWAVHKGKVPYNPRTWQRAKTNDPGTFGTRGEADAALASGKYDGVGFLVDQSLDVSAIDLDGLIAEDGSLPAPIQDIVKRADTYTELSPSGTGLHMIFGVADDIPRKNQASTLCRKAEGYNRVRFMTFTGNRLPGTPEAFSSDLDTLRCVLDTLGLVARKPDPDPATHSNGSAGSQTNRDILELAFRAKNGDKIRRLWDGDTSDYPSASEADAAFISFMSFYTSDPAQLASLLVESGLARRKTQRPDYVNRTVQFALNNHNGETYTSPTPQATGRVTFEGAPDPGSTDPIENGDALLDDVYRFLGRFVAYPSDHAQVAHTLWLAHTHVMDAWDSTPRLALLSPEPASGKTRALEISELLVPNPVEAVNVSPAYLFRKVGNEGVPPTILFDEIDTVFGARTKDNNEEIRGLLNAGHRRGAVAGRCVVRGTVVETEEIPAYCAVALAGLGDLPDTILSRAVLVRMRRRRAGESVEPYRRRLHVATGHDIRDQLAQWTASIADQLSGAWPKMPAGVEDRNADIYEPLFALADAAGGDWPERARVAAVALIADAQASTPSLGIQLLTDIRSVFAGADKVSTEDLLKGLVHMPEAPWGDLRGKPLDSRRLSRMLRKYEVRSKQIRVNDLKTAKGYAREDLDDAWSRYLPSPETSETSETNETMSDEPSEKAHGSAAFGVNGFVSDSASYPKQAKPIRNKGNTKETEKAHETGHVSDVSLVSDLRGGRRADAPERRVKV